MENVEPQRGSHFPPEPNPALIRHAEERRQSVENRIADRITAFAGSMRFVYIHIVWFGCWIGFGVESYPYGLLTMIVSLEAIFLSTFVMISQNRADAKRQAIADQQWQKPSLESEQLRGGGSGASARGRDGGARARRCRRRTRPGIRNSARRARP